MTPGEKKKYEDRTAAFIEAELSHIYCHNCKFNDGRDCDECNRKAMGWSIDPAIAKQIAKKIFEE